MGENDQMHQSTSACFNRVGGRQLHSKSPQSLEVQAHDRRCALGREGQDHAVHTMKRDKDSSTGLWLTLFYFEVPLLLDEADQSIRGGIVGGHGRVALQLRFDFLGQLLPQLHPAREGWKRKMSQVPEPTQRHNRPFLSNSPPLVEAVDVPDDALNEDLVFIHGCRGRSGGCPQGPFFLPSLLPFLLPSHPIQLMPSLSVPPSPHSPIKAPSMNGVSLVNTIELVGRFPSNT